MNLKCLSTAFTITSDGRSDSSVCKTLNIAMNVRIQNNASKVLPNFKPTVRVNVFEAISKKNGNIKNIIT